MEHTTHRFVIGGGIVLMAGLVYLNALHNPFVYDDYHTVVANTSLEHVGNLRAIVLHDVTRPIMNFTYAIDRAIWGPRPFGFHATNVLLHMLNVALLFQLAWRLSGNGLAAASAASLFAVHPMMTEAVGYISGRSEVLCAMWFLIAFMCGRRWLLDGRARWGLLTVGCWVAALGTKETAAMFPFVLVAYDWLALPDMAAERRRRLMTVHLPLIAMTLVAGIARLLVLAYEYPGRVVVHWRYLLLDVDVVARYLALMVRPVGQTIFHAVPLVGVLHPRALIAVASVGLLVAMVWRLRRTDWIVSFGVVWFLLLLVPSSVLILLDQGEPMTEHRVYVASGGLFLAIGSTIAWLEGWLQQHKPAAVPFAGGALALVVMSFCVNTVARNAVWADPVRLWRESADLAPSHYRPRLLLGEALQDAGRRAEAMEQYKTAIVLRPGDATGYVKLGRCYAETARLPEARQLFLKALDVDPQNASARQSLATLDTLETKMGVHAVGR